MIRLCSFLALIGAAQEHLWRFSRSEVMTKFEHVMLGKLQIGTLSGLQVIVAKIMLEVSKISKGQLGAASEVL